MKITFFGHNCYALQGTNVVVLTDPWLTKNGAFFGSWFQWPINHHYKDNLKDILNTKNNTILYISHEHQDHFDKETLIEIQPLVDLCIIPDYEDKFLRNELLTMGYKIQELRDQTKHFLNHTDYIELMIVDTGVNHDSAAIFKIDEETFLNQNDCKVFDRLTYLQDKSIDYYAVQFSGATWHPVCYDLSDDEKKKISKKKVLSKLVAVRNAINVISPKFYLPSAGPAIFPFLDESLSLGIDNIFLHQPDLDKFLKNTDTKLIYLQPGETLDRLSDTLPIQPPTNNELLTLKKNLDCEFKVLSDLNFEVDQLITQIENRIEKIKDINFSQCPNLLFDWNQQGLEIDLNHGKVKFIDWTEYEFPDSYMKVTASMAYFHLMSDPSYRWQDIYLSLRASVQRVPDVFNTFVNIFLFSDASNIRSAFLSTLDIKDEKILIVNPLDGKNYEINRYCPHNGADLKDARIDQDGNLICPRHSWLFNLNNNGKCESADVTIDAREVIETISLCETASARLLKMDG
ncbi:MBL fold metallo-hydrolase [Amylibacter sp.]|nr:MBL fold metallo-hydrolase [Amylibacter sp.]